MYCVATDIQIIAIKGIIEIIVSSAIEFQLPKLL